MLNEKGTNMEKYAKLMTEVEAINSWMGTVGVLDALMWINEHIEEYDGPVLYEYRTFMREGAQLFAPKRA
jgi:hypothetical protein